MLFLPDTSMCLSAGSKSDPLLGATRLPAYDPTAALADTSSGRFAMRLGRSPPAWAVLGRAGSSAGIGSCSLSGSLLALRGPRAG